MAGPRDDGTFAEDKANHPGRKVGHEMRGMTKETLAHFQANGYSHPTGPTTILGDTGAGIARSSYRMLRKSGVNKQEARSEAIATGITGGRDSTQGAKGYGNK